jgi:hypothetical protein
MLTFPTIRCQQLQDTCGSIWPCHKCCWKPQLLPQVLLETPTPATSAAGNPNSCHKCCWKSQLLPQVLLETPTPATASWPNRKLAASGGHGRCTQKTYVISCSICIVCGSAGAIRVQDARNAQLGDSQLWECPASVCGFMQLCGVAVVACMHQKQRS